jgi:Rab5 GDP/GTP exchange factor
MTTTPTTAPSPDSTSNILPLDPPLAPVDQLADPNPWRDPSMEGGTEVLSKHRLETPEPSALDESITMSFVPPSPSNDPPADTIHARLHEEVLREFDPLANQEEQAAREAWADAEAHPPPPRTPSPPAPLTKDASHLVPDTPSPPAPVASSSSSSFPSLAALARSFSIPSIPRSRPVSFDFAKAVPSPATLSTFASQQQEQQPQNPDGVAVEGSYSPHGGGTESSRHGAGDGNVDGKEKEKEQPFDFQKFLDQMKLKAAEPVAKYLRSCVMRFC